MQQEQVIDGYLHYMQFVIIMHVLTSNQSCVNSGNIYKWGCLIYWGGGGALAEKFRVGARPNGLKFGYWPDRTDLPGSKFLGEFLLRNAVNVVIFCKKCGECCEKKTFHRISYKCVGMGKCFSRLRFWLHRTASPQPKFIRPNLPWGWGPDLCLSITRFLH